MTSLKKIQAFTITEMIVVLILTSIVVGLAFTVLSLVQKQMLGIQANFQANTELLLFEQSLWLDFNRYSSIEFDANENMIEFKSPIDSVTYRFNEKNIVKDIDTFVIPLNFKAFYFEGNQVDKGRIDAIKLEATKEFQSKKLFVFKQNDSNLFMTN